MPPTAHTIVLIFTILASQVSTIRPAQLPQSPVDLEAKSCTAANSYITLGDAFTTKISPELKSTTESHIWTVGFITKGQACEHSAINLLLYSDPKRSPITLTKKLSPYLENDYKYVAGSEPYAVLDCQVGDVYARTSHHFKITKD
jgi:hypothetical protein